MPTRQSVEDQVGEAPQDSPVNGTPSLETVNAIAADAPRFATFDQLRAKPRRKLTFPVHTVDEDGEEVILQMTYKALTNREYDDLVEQYPPTPKEKNLGAQYNILTFSPALVAAVSFEPRLNLEQAKEIFSSDTWSGGELATLFINAQRVCNSGLDVPFIARD